MTNPFRNKVTVTDAKYVSLTPSPDAPELSVQIKHPGSLSPIEHSVNHVDPHENMEAYRQLVRSKVAALYSRGALDQDNMRALQQEIAGLRETWTDDVRQKAESRRKVAATLLAQISQNLETATFRLDASRRRSNEVMCLREQLRQKLGIDSGKSDDSESLEHLLNPKTSLVSRHLNLLQTTPHDNTKGDER